MVLKIRRKIIAIKFSEQYPGCEKETSKNSTTCKELSIRYKQIQRIIQETRKQLAANKKKLKKSELSVKKPLKTQLR